MASNNLTRSGDLSAKWGPAMRRLTERQREFVMVLLESGTSNMSKAARQAGYIGNDETIAVTGYRLSHDLKVQAAIQEEAGRRLHTGGIMATSRLLNIAENSMDEKTALKAIEMVLNRTGLHAVSEHKVQVDYSTNDPSDQIKRVRNLALTLGLDPAQLLGNAGVTMIEDKTQPVDVIDGEFEEAAPATSLDGLEDIL